MVGFLFGKGLKGWRRWARAWGGPAQATPQNRPHRPAASVYSR